jgi:nucleoside-diphosphate-sugar epimerase
MAATVLVTGASGGLGTQLVPLLRERGYRVRALVHRHPVDGADETVRGDLLDQPSLADAVRGADSVLHLAALTHARTAADYYRFNVTGTENLVQAAGAANTGRFVYVSTRAIGPEGGGYSKSKRAAEAVVADSGLEYTIVRLPEVFGAGSSEGVDQMLEAARGGRPILVVGNGGQQLCPAHIDDVLPAVVEALSVPAAAGRTYTLAGECTTMRELAESVAAATGRGSRIVGLPRLLVRAAGAASRVAPLPLYPDQYARLHAPKPPASPEAEADLGFRPRGLDDAIRSLAA